MLSLGLVVLRGFEGGSVMDKKRSIDSEVMSLFVNTRDAIPNLSIWRHRKGGVYEVKAIALSSDTLDPIVVYTRTDGVWPAFTRPASEFLDGRFERINKEGQADE